jgi:hypothetical protein
MTRPPIRLLYAADHRLYVSFLMPALSLLQLLLAVFFYNADFNQDVESPFNIDIGERMESWSCFI